MTVYIEYVFASNFVFDFALLFALTKISKVNVSKKRLVFATLTGTVIAIVLPLVNLGVVLSILAKLCLSVCIIFALGGYKTKKQFFSMLILFWSLTFGMGGVLVGIYFLTDTNFALQQDLSVVSDSPLPLFVAGLIVFFFLTKTVVAYVNGKKAKAGFEYDVTVFVGDARFVAKGFLDSGNSLCDNQTGLPVVIVTSKKMKEFFAYQLSHLVDKTCLLKQVHYISFGTLSGDTQKMLVFMADRVEVAGCEKQVMIGIANKKISFAYDLLLNVNMGI